MQRKLFGTVEIAALFAATGLLMRVSYARLCGQLTPTHLSTRR
jgi:hypothetical protein